MLEFGCCVGVKGREIETHKRKDKENEVICPIVKVRSINKGSD